jgi:hypothetical protein
MPVLVAPARTARGTLPLAVLAGALSGVAGSLLNEAVRRAGWSQAGLDWFGVSATLGPNVLAIISASLCSKRRRAFLVASLFTCFQFVALTLTDIIDDPNGIQGALILTGWDALLALVAFSLVVGSFGLGGQWLRSGLALTILVQDGSLCWRCGYVLGAESIVICPECGTPRGKGRRMARSVRVLDAIKRGSRPALLAAAILATTVVVAKGAQPRSRSLARFYLRFGQPTGGYVDGPKGPIQCAGSWVGFRPGPGPGIWISYLPDEAPGAPAMQLRLAALSTGSMGDAIAPIPGITCELDRAQAQWVITHGLPDSLVGVFRRSPAAPGPTVHVPAASYIPDQSAP